MGSNSYMMPKIKRAFEHSNHVLTSALQKNNSKSYLAYIVRPDDPNLMDRPGPELNSAKTNADAMKEND